MEAHSAIKLSCDIYFYTLGQRLGIERSPVTRACSASALLTGIDITGDRRSPIPTSEWSKKVRKQP